MTNTNNSKSSEYQTIVDLIDKEQNRQIAKIGLIPSENNTSPEVSGVLSSCLSNKYSEGYSGARYYEGSQIIDEIETLAIERVKKLFGVPFANVQAYSGSPANSAIYFALLEPHDTIMGLRLDMGGHLTHGHPKVTFSGKYFNSVQYGVNKDARIDFDELRMLAKEHQPKLIVAGNTSYPFELNFKVFREIADEVGAWLIADISHIAGLVIAGEHPSPVPYADVVMTTTHKTLRGPRGAVILVTERGLQRDPKICKNIDSAIIPGLQGGPHNATTAAIAIAASEAMKPEYKLYAKQVKKNAAALAQSLLGEGLTLVGGGTENHLVVLDVSTHGYGLGKQVAFAMDVAGMYANRNTIPHEPVSPFYPSGIRLGTPLVTTRGMKEAEMKQIGKWIAKVVEHVKGEDLPKDVKSRPQFIQQFINKTQNDPFLLGIYEEVKMMTGKFPLFQW